MRDIDLGPDDYRKRDPRTGRWLQNVDRRLCRWGSLIGLGASIMFAVSFYLDGEVSLIPALAVGFVFGASSGGLMILSLKNPDW